MSEASEARRARNAASLARAALGTTIEKAFEIAFQARYRYVYKQVKISALVEASKFTFPGVPYEGPALVKGGKQPTVDFLVGDSLDDLKSVDIKSTLKSSFTDAQRVSYPKFVKNGGEVVRAVAATEIALPKGATKSMPALPKGTKLKPQSLHVILGTDFEMLLTRELDVDGLVSARKVDASLTSPEITRTKSLQLKQPFSPTASRHTANNATANTGTPGEKATVGDRATGNRLDAAAAPGEAETPSNRGATSTITREGGEVAATSSAPKRTTPKPRIVERGKSTVTAAARRLKAGSLRIGIKAWRTFRVVGAIAVTLFVPLKALDVVFEIALALWDRDREREERRRREKQRALAEVFKQKEERIQQLIQSKVLGADAQQQLMNNWDRSHAVPGFLYARVNAMLEIHSYHPITNLEVAGPAIFKVIDVDVMPNTAFFDFELTSIGEDRAADQTEADRKMLVERKIVYPEMLRKIVKRRRLRYTVVPPLVTPFDIVVTKINNLFMDTVLFAASFEGIGNEIFGDSFRFDYKSTYDAQLVFDLQFPEPLKASTCHFCLGYLHWAAKLLSQHPLTEQDIQGNLEDPVKGWKRRHGLLLSLVEGRGTTYGKNFSYLTDRMRELISRDKLDPDAESAVNELHAGSRAIWADLQRIERNVGRPEYFYYGPNYSVPKF